MTPLERRVAAYEDAVRAARLFVTQLNNGERLRALLADERLEAGRDEDLVEEWHEMVLDLGAEPCVSAHFFLAELRRIAGAAKPAEGGKA